MVTVKIYRNDSDADMDVVGIGEVPAHGQVSIATEYHYPVNLVNYPGLVDVIAEEEAAQQEATDEQG